MNPSSIEGKWNEIKGEIRTMWGNLTGDDLESTKGNVESIVGLIQQKYGSAKDEVSEKVKAVFLKFEDSAREQREAAYRTANLKTDEAKEKLRN